jgi:hypothetical protein
MDQSLHVHLWFGFDVPVFTATAYIHFSTPSEVQVIDTATAKLRQALIEVCHAAAAATPLPAGEAAAAARGCMPAKSERGGWV